MTTLADLLKPQNVSSYYDTRLGLTDPSNTSQLDALNAAKTSAASPLDPAMVNQIWSVLAAGPVGTGADPQLAAARDYLMQNGLLQDVPANTGDANTAERYQLGINAPHNFSGYALTGDTPDEGLRLSSVQQMTGNGQTLVNPDMHAVDPLYGDLTLQANVKQPKSAMDTFWKIAPMLPGLFAFGLPSLLGEGLSAAGGATAGALAGDQTLSDIGGGALSGTASASDALSSLPSWIQSQVPNAIKGGIGSLNSNDGKFNPLGTLSSFAGAGLGQLGVPSWLTPALSAAMNANKSPIGAATSLASIFGRAGQ
jgi:hypothetical protein